jgi:hypothetical protein
MSTRWSILALLAALSVASCARVKPYQREIHAKKSMQDKAPVDEKLEGHVHEYREGSVGGSGVGGGGCGCN